MDLWPQSAVEKQRFVFFVQHEDASSSGNLDRQELGYLEEERVRVLARIDELKNRLMELEQQLQESKQEVQHAA